MQRRRFIGSLAAGSLGAAWSPAEIARPPASASEANAPAASAPTPADRTMQRLHPDAQTDPAGVEYFFLGNGKIVAAIQHATGEALAMGQTPLGLMLWDPHHFARKWSTFTFHPEWGLKRGMVSVAVGDATYGVDPATLQVTRAYPDGVPVVEARWTAGPCSVTERFWVAADAPLLIREIAVDHPTAGSADVALTTALYHNHILFTDYRTDHAAGVLRADGYPHLELYAVEPADLTERYLTVRGTAAPGEAATARLCYVIRTTKEATASVPVAARRREAQRYWQAFTTVETPEPALDALYRAGRDNLRAAVAESGRFDASVWQYNMEWTVDAAGVIRAACRTGQFDLAASLLDNVLTRLVDERGITAHASRFRDGFAVEVNQQGELLGAAWTYWAWSGDLDLIRRHWDTLSRVAEVPLGSPYRHESGLVMAGVELFERDASAGVRPGFDVTHQSVIAWGLEKAAVLAREVGDDASAERWGTAGAAMRDAMLHHPTLALVDDGRLIKRRLPDGRRQTTLAPEATGTDLIPADSPLARERRPLLDPDIGTLWPVLLGQVDPGSPLAQHTLDAVATLWNEPTGGYLRYHPSGDPDAPGGWTFPTALVGQAMARAGRGAEVRRILDWFTTVQGARGGAYFEIYTTAPRPVPPLPPMGVIVWGWAEIASLFVRGLLGAEPVPSAATLRLDPHLPAGLDTLRANVRFRDRRIAVNVRRGDNRRATFNGRALAYDGGFTLPASVPDGRIDIDLP